MKKRMFTSFEGRDRFNNNQSFWAWEVNKEEFEDSKFELEVDEAGFEVEDVGLYHVKDLSKVNWIK